MQDSKCKRKRKKKKKKKKKRRRVKKIGMSWIGGGGGEGGEMPWCEIRTSEKAERQGSRDDKTTRGVRRGYNDT